jgi:triosephosphate isomerase
MIFLNFKTYKEATGEACLSLTKVALEVAKEQGVKIVVCPQEVDLRKALEIEGVSIWAQHVDTPSQGKSTGWFPTEVAKDVGVQGVLLNHSEHKLSTGELGETLSNTEEAGLSTLVFADTLEEARVVSRFKPDYIGYEPPELIASPDTSVAKAKPEVIRDVVTQLPDSKIIVGAGIKERQDVKVSLELGAIGVGLSSAFVLADKPKEVLTNLARGFKK